MSKITNIWNFPLIDNLYLEEDMHPDIPKLIRHFQDQHDFPQLDSSLFDISSTRFMKQAQWSRLMIDYYCSIPENLLCESNRWLMYFDPDQIRKVVSIKTAKSRGIILMDYRHGDSDGLVGEATDEVDDIKKYFRTIAKQMEIELRLTLIVQRLKLLESKAEIEDKALSWSNFDVMETKFLREQIAASLCYETLLEGEVTFESETDFFSLKEQDLKHSLPMYLPFLDQLSSLCDEKIEMENTLSDILARSGPVNLEKNTLILTVLGRGYEWRGFIFGCPRSQMQSVHELIQAHATSDYNRFQILGGLEETEYEDEKLEVFGIMRFDPKFHPLRICKGSLKEFFTLLDFSEVYRVCRACEGTVYPDETCTNGCDSKV